MTKETFNDMVFPRDLPRLRVLLEEWQSNGDKLDAALVALAEVSPSALLDVVIGPDAVSGPQMCKAALQVLEHLESMLSAGALYQRLVQLAGEFRLDVLSAAIQRHPTAEWIVAISRSCEGELAGQSQLIACGQLPDFWRLCEAHAGVGHRGGLVAAGTSLCRVEPSMALLCAGDLAGAAEAAAALLAVAPQLGVVEHLAAAFGPDLQPLLEHMVRHVRDCQTGEHLQRVTRWYPEVDMVLAQRMKEWPP